MQSVNDMLLTEENLKDLDYALVVRIESYNDQNVSDMLDGIGFGLPSDDVLEYLIKWDNGDGHEVYTYDQVSDELHFSGFDSIEDQVIGNDCDYVMVINHEFDYVSLYRPELKK